MKSLSLFLCIGAVLCGTACNADVPALHSGEALTYRVGWGIFPHAGEINVSAQAENAGGVPLLRVTTTTATTGVLKVFFPFEAKAESLFDTKTGRFLSSVESSVSKRKKTHQSLTFDYAAGKTSYVNVIEPSRSAELPLPPGDPMDLIMSLVQTRTWNLTPGEKQDMIVIFDDDFYELTVHAERYEKVSTPLGVFNTLMLVPRMEKTPPKGMFKRGSSVRVWISQDDRHLPVQFEVEFKFGSGLATLSRYEPPAPLSTAAGQSTPQP